MAAPDRPQRTPTARQARTSAGKPIPAGVARDLSELARELQAASTADLLQRVVEFAIAEIDGAEQCGISVITRNGIVTRARTGEVVSAVDRAQYALRDGPCVSALHDQATVRVDDLGHDGRWPRFARAALDHGIASMLSAQLFVEDNNLGALNMYATVPSAFSDDDETVALLLAAHAAVALGDALQIDNLRTAVSTRDVIGQAKGILMERFKIDANEAFGLLVAVSQHRHLKLNLVAEQLALTGELPELRDDPLDHDVAG